MDPHEFIPTRASLLDRLKDWEDQTSWREFFDTYWRLIYNVGRKAGLTGPEAQDALQETLLAVAKKLPGFTYDPAVDSFKGWLLTVTQWKIADQFRKRKSLSIQSSCSVTTPTGCTPKRGAQTDGPETTTIERVADPVGFDLQVLWDKEWEDNLLHAALDRLKRRVKPEHYEMYYLHVLQEQSARDVARTLGVSAAQIHLAKHRVGRILKAELKSLKYAGEMGK